MTQKTSPELLLLTVQDMSVTGIHPIRNAEEGDHAAHVLRCLQSLKSSGDQARKEEKAPHLAAGRAVDARYKPALDEIDRVIGLVKDRLEERALALADVREAAVQTGTALALEDSVPAEGISERWTWELERVSDWRLVPKEYLELNAKALRETIKVADKEAREPSVPGLVFRRRVRIVARGMK